MAEVLIIDRDADSRTMLAWYLGLEGHEVTEASSAHEALGALARSTPEVIVTDLVLPDMSGHQLLAHMRSNAIAPEAAVIVLTASQDTSWMVRSWELGASVHLTKPIGPELVADAVTRQVRPRQVALSS